MRAANCTRSKVAGLRLRIAATPEKIAHPTLANVLVVNQVPQSAYRRLICSEKFWLRRGMSVRWERVRWTLRPVEIVAADLRCRPRKERYPDPSNLFLTDDQLGRENGERHRWFDSAQDLRSELIRLVFSTTDTEGVGYPVNCPSYSQVGGNRSTVQVQAAQIVQFGRHVYDECLLA